MGGKIHPDLSRFREIYETVRGLFPMLRSSGGDSKNALQASLPAGQGPPFCNIGKCCQEKKIQGCWQCVEFVTCTALPISKISARLNVTEYKGFLPGGGFGNLNGESFKREGRIERLTRKQVARFRRTIYLCLLP